MSSPIENLRKLLYSNIKENRYLTGEVHFEASVVKLLNDNSAENIFCENGIIYSSAEIYKKEKFYFELLGLKPEDVFTQQEIITVHEKYGINKYVRNVGDFYENEVFKPRPLYWDQEDEYDEIDTFKAKTQKQEKRVTKVERTHIYFSKEEYEDYKNLKKLLKSLRRYGPLMLKNEGCFMEIYKKLTEGSVKNRLTAKKEYLKNEPETTSEPINRKQDNENLENKTGMLETCL